jgi:hypothetical protein
MFGIFKKNVDSLELVDIFIKVVTPLIQNHKSELINIGFVEDKVKDFIKSSNKNISNEQLITIKYASQILGLNEDLQQKILQLNQANVNDTREKFIEIWDEFKSYGCFC